MTVPPMDFETMVRRGLGRAVLYAREHNVSMHRDFLLHACLHNLSYDAQADASRSHYMYDLLKTNHDFVDCSGEICKAAIAPSQEYDLYHIYEILSLLARDGDEPARDALYQSVARDATVKQYDGIDSLIALDGLTGLFFCLEQITRHEMPEDDVWRLEFAFDNYIKRHGEKETDGTLDRAMQEKIELAPHVARLRSIRAKSKARPRYRPSPNDHKGYNEIAHVIATATTGTPHRLMRWGKEANDETTLKIAFDFLEETDDTRLPFYLRFFDRRAFPLSLTRMLGLAVSQDRRTAWAARRALSNVADPSVRALALQLLNSPVTSFEAVPMLAQNYAEGDWLIVTEAVMQNMNEDPYHSIECDVLQFFDAHSAPDAKDALLALYERGPCTLCRSHVVEKLMTLGSLPDWMTEECRYDAYDQTRKLVNDFTGSVD